MTKEEQTNLRELVKKDKLGEAIEALLSFEAHNKDFIALASRLTAFDKKVNGNTAKVDDLAIERNQITEVILKYIERFPLTPSSHLEANQLDNIGQPLVGKGTIASVTIENSTDMKAYEFYFSIRDQLLIFIEASKNWRLGIYRDDQNRAEAIGDISLQLLKLKNHLELNHLEDSLMFELSILCIELLESAENELLILVTGKKTSNTGLKLKLNNIQKKLIELILEIDKKLHIDQASKG